MRRLLAAALVLGCAPVGSASASEPDGIGPRAIVATAPGAELGAADHAPGLRLCLDLQVGGEDIDQVCEPRRHTPPSGLLLVGYSDIGSSAALPNTDRVAGVAAPAAAARVELRFAGGAVRSAPTVAGEAYRGASAGRVRFALFTGLPPGDLETVVGFAADGTAIAAEDRGNGPTAAGPSTLIGTGGRRLRMRVVAPLEPSAIDRLRRGRSFCLTYGSTGGEDCQRVEEEGRRGSIAYRTTCSTGDAAVVGLLPPGAIAARALLTTGRRVAVPTRAIPQGFGLGARRAALLRVPPGEGVRALEPRGGAVRRIELRHEPASIACERPGASGYTSEELDAEVRVATLARPLPGAAAGAAPRPAATRAGAVGLDAADDASGRLCLVLRTRSGSRGRCDTLGPERDAFTLVVAGDASGTLVGLAAREGAARASLTFSDGRTDTVDLVAPLAYTGAYARVSRFGVLRTTTKGADVVTVRLLRPDGGNLLDVEIIRSRGAPRRLARLPGGSAAWLGVFSLVGDGRYGCLSLRPTRPPDVFDCLVYVPTDPSFSPRGALRVTCGPAGTVAVGLVPGSTRRITAVLGGGRRRAGQLFRLGDRRNAAFLARAPRGQTLRVVEVLSRNGTRRRLDTGLLRRSSQCGFDLELGPWVTVREPGSSR